MRRRRRRHPRLAQVERLQARCNAVSSTLPFYVDHELATAIWQASERLQLLEPRKALAPEYIEEKERLRASIHSKFEQVGLVEGYSLEQYRKDKKRFRDLSYGTSFEDLSEKQKYEAVQLRAMLGAYDRSPEARGRERISFLERKNYYPDGKMPAADEEEMQRQKGDWPGVRTPQENEELEALNALYPKLPPEPLSPFDLARPKIVAAFSEGAVDNEKTRAAIALWEQVQARFMKK
jgi:hypothetical protein